MNRYKFSVVNLFKYHQSKPIAHSELVITSNLYLSVSISHVDEKFSPKLFLLILYTDWKYFSMLFKFLHFIFCMCYLFLLLIILLITKCWNYSKIYLEKYNNINILTSIIFYSIFFFTDEAIYECNNCHRRYVRKSSLLLHKKHKCGQAQNFSCELCEYKTHYKGSLKRHMITQHISYVLQDNNLWNYQTRAYSPRKL